MGFDVVVLANNAGHALLYLFEIKEQFDDTDQSRILSSP
jgi:hypothetical protein